MLEVNTGLVVTTNNGNRNDSPRIKKKPGRPKKMKPNYDKIYNLSQLQSALSGSLNGWTDKSTKEYVRLVKLTEQSSSHQPVSITHCITINPDLTWKASSPWDKMWCMCGFQKLLESYAQSMGEMEKLITLNTYTAPGSHTSSGLQELLHILPLQQ